MSNAKRISILVAAIIYSGAWMAAQQPPVKSGRPAYETETWPKARLLIWARPGETGDCGASNWLEDGKPAERGPDKDTDLILPADPQARNYTVHANNAEFRHLTIEKKARFIASHVGNAWAWGNVWVKDGGRIHAVSVKGPKHTFFRLDNGEFPKPNSPARYRFTFTPSAYGDDSLHSSSHIMNKMQIVKYGDGSVEFIGNMGITDEFLLEHGRMIINGIFRYNANGRGIFEVFDGATLELQSGAVLAPFVPVGWGQYNLSVYKGGTLQAGSPERPLTSSAYLLQGNAESPPATGEGGIAGLYAAIGSKIRVFSSDPTKARLVIATMALRPDIADLEGMPYPDLKAKGDSQGVEAHLAGDAQLNGVLFDYVRKGGIRLADLAMKDAWENVLYGPHNAGPPEELYGRIAVKADAYYHNRPYMKYYLLDDARSTMSAFYHKLGIEPKGGLFVEGETVKVKLVIEDVPDAKIHYTLDESEPSEHSPLYTKPIVITSDTTLKAHGYAEGLKPNPSVFPATTYKFTVPREAEDPGNVIPGLEFKYYESLPDPKALATFNASIPDFSNLTPVKTGVVNNFDLRPRGRDENFGMFFRGLIRIPKPGIYTFYLNSDDGSRLYIGPNGKYQFQGEPNQNQVVFNDSYNPRFQKQEKSGSIALKGGYQTIIVLYQQMVGNFELEVSYSGPGLPKQPIPSSLLFHAATSPGSK